MSLHRIDYNVYRVLYAGDRWKASLHPHRACSHSRVQRCLVIVYIMCITYIRIPLFYQNIDTKFIQMQSGYGFLTVLIFMSIVHTLLSVGTSAHLRNLSNYTIQFIRSHTQQLLASCGYSSALMPHLF